MTMLCYPPEQLPVTAQVLVSLQVAVKPTPAALLAQAVLQVDDCTNAAGGASCRVGCVGPASTEGS
jgi:hypothetical protein